MHVIGTAGHVDHGKSSLIRALTGIDPDRLKEEKEREMTIDLGFAWMSLPGDGGEVGIVDVPGHEDFIENMLAGVGGIDLALLVVAADEGVMPQTREHLAILDLLSIRGGVVALTKTDLVDDPDWLELVILDVSDELAHTTLADAPIVPVSSRTGHGIEDVRQALVDSLARVEEKEDGGQPRLPIDRVFTLPGFGTIVTGTLTGGSLSVGQGVVFQPAGIKARIRGLQTHRTKLNRAHPGSRVAVNVTGVSREEVDRGQVLTTQGTLSGTILCDAQYRHLDSAPGPLRHNVMVKVHTGTAEVVGRTRLLGSRQLLPGEEGWLQLALTSPIAVARGDHFILRRPSPSATLGGGRILDPHPGRRHRRFRKAIIDKLEILARGSIRELVIQELYKKGPMVRSELFERLGHASTEAGEIWDTLLADQDVLDLGQYVMTPSLWQRLSAEIVRQVENHHDRFPLRRGMAREELRSRLNLNTSLFNALITAAAEQGLVSESAITVALPGHNVELSQEQQSRVSSLFDRLDAAGVNSISVKESIDYLGQELYYALIDLGQLRQLSDDVVYSANVYEGLESTILDFLKRHGKASAADIRDMLGTSRKYAIALLEYLDAQDITRRVGDDRVLNQYQAERK